MARQPYEVSATQRLHSHLIVATHAALEDAVEMTRKPAHEKFERRYWSTLGHNMSWCLHNALATRLGNEVDWFNDRGFLAMVDRDNGVAMRLGSSDAQGRPHDTKDREDGAPFTTFLEGLPLLFEDSELRPVFGGYSLRRRRNEVDVERFVLAKYRDREHVWSWGLDLVDPGQVRAVLDGSRDAVEIVATRIEVPLQRRFG